VGCASSDLRAFAALQQEPLLTLCEDLGFLPQMAGEDRCKPARDGTSLGR